ALRRLPTPPAIGAWRPRNGARAHGPFRPRPWLISPPKAPRGYATPPEPSMTLPLGFRKAASGPTNRQGRLLAEFTQILEDVFRDPVAGEPAVQNLIELAGYVEVKLHGIAIIEARIAALDVHQHDRVATGLAVRRQCQCAVLEVAQRTQRHIHGFSPAHQRRGRGRRRITQHSWTRGHEDSVVDDDVIARDLDGYPAAQGASACQAIDLRQLQQPGE